YADIVVAEDVGGAPRVKVYSGSDGSVLASFLAFGAGFRGGVRVAAANLTNDGNADVVAGARANGAPIVEVYDGQKLVRGIATPALAFDAFAPSFRGGVFVATGDVHGDGIPKIIAGEGPGGAPRVSVFDGMTGAQLQTFLAFSASF